MHPPPQGPEPQGSGHISGDYQPGLSCPHSCSLQGWEGAGQAEAALSSSSAQQPPPPPHSGPPPPGPGQVQDKFKVPAPAPHPPIWDQLQEGLARGRDRATRSSAYRRERTLRDSVGCLVQEGRRRPREEPLAPGHTHSQGQGQHWTFLPLPIPKHVP